MKPATKSPPSTTVRCTTCKTAKRQRAMKIYDVPNDKFFCNEVCESARPDRIGEES